MKGTYLISCSWIKKLRIFIPSSFCGLSVSVSQKKKKSVFFLIDSSESERKKINTLLLFVPQLSILIHKGNTTTHIFITVYNFMIIFVCELALYIHFSHVFFLSVPFSVRFVFSFYVFVQYHAQWNFFQLGLLSTCIPNGTKIIIIFPSL